MSDETPPPSLRLKPRQRTDAEAPPPPPPTGGASADGGKLRLKPKLNVEAPAVAAAEPPPAPAEPAPAPEAAPAPERVRLKPKLNAEPAQPAAGPPPATPPEAHAETDATGEGEATEETAVEEEAPAPDAPKPKLKIKIPGALSDAPPDGAPVDPNVPPPFPVVLAPGAEGSPIPTSGSRPGMPRPGAPVRRLPAEVQAKKNRTKKIIKLLLVGVGSVALAAGMLKFAMVKFIDPPPPPPSIIPKPRPPVKIAPIVDVPNPPETDTETKPAQAETPAPKPVRAVKTPPKKSGETTTKATSDLAPGVTVTSDAVQAEAEASSEFRTFVADAKVSGVFQGSPSRAFINGRLVRAGEVIDSAMGIKFDSADAATKTIVFVDARGAKVAKHY